MPEQVIDISKLKRGEIASKVKKALKVKPGGLTKIKFAQKEAIKTKLFPSEVRALIANPTISKKLSERSATGFLLSGHRLMHRGDIWKEYTPLDQAVRYVRKKELMPVARRMVAKNKLRSTAMNVLGKQAIKQFGWALPGVSFVSAALKAKDVYDLGKAGVNLGKAKRHEYKTKKHTEEKYGSVAKAIQTRKEFKR